jgi:hypothetical protein
MIFITFNSDSRQIRFIGVLALFPKQFLIEFMLFQCLQVLDPVFHIANYY